MQFIKISPRCGFLAMDCRRGHLFGGVALNQSLDGLAEKVFRQRKAGRRRFNVGLCKDKHHPSSKAQLGLIRNISGSKIRCLMHKQIPDTYFAYFFKIT